jgi:hypothetical protein
MKWTKELPTRPGYYWTWDGWNPADGNARVAHVDVDLDVDLSDGGDRVHVTSQFLKDRLWAGPLALPERDGEPA